MSDHEEVEFSLEDEMDMNPSPEDVKNVVQDDATTQEEVIEAEAVSSEDVPFDDTDKFSDDAERSPFEAPRKQGSSAPSESTHKANPVPMPGDAAGPGVPGNTGEPEDFGEPEPTTGTDAIHSAVGDDSVPIGEAHLPAKTEEKHLYPGRIGERLVSMGIITEDQLNVALQEKKVSGKLLGEIMVDLGFIDAETLSTFLAEITGFEVFDPKNTLFDGEALDLIDKQTAVKYHLLPVSLKDGVAVVAMSDPYDVVAMDTLRRYLPKDITLKPVVCTPTILTEAIDAAYGYASSINGILAGLEEGAETVPDLTTLDEDQAYSHPIVRLVNALVYEAVKLGVSDLHFEPEENFVRLRYRKDGVLFTAQILHKQHWSSMAQRIKIISEMNIADKLSPQDGRFSINIGGKEADFRVSSLPTVHGENIVLRVLDQSESIMPMSALGFSDLNRDLIKRSQSRPEGIIIVTGPTGSGKTTSLYSMLNEINDVEVNIQTLEDPVEYSLPMIRQTHVREGVLEFADGIKALLRQDPDIIFIGEIRDGETAQMALKAAMTGHQVYTTLHTNDSFGAIPRLFDLGLKPGMVAGAIVSVFAQRLVRRVCGECRESYTASAEECELLGVDPSDPPTIFKAKQGGCRVCSGMGYKGRTAVVEILFFDEDLDELLARGVSKAELKIKAVEKGFKSMRDDGMLKILDGITTFEALTKVVNVD